MALSQPVTIFLHPKYPRLNQKAKSDFAAQAIYAGDDLQVSQLILEDGALYPGSDNIIDLGKSDNEFKDALNLIISRGRRSFFWR